jgi:hypothetical protein
VNQEVLRDTMLGAQREGRTVIFSTHNMEQAEQLCESRLHHRRGAQGAGRRLREIQRQHLGRRYALEFEAVRARSRRCCATAPFGGRGGGRGWRSTSREGADPRELLGALRGLDVPLIRFERVQPSLHEIFVATSANAATAQRRPEPTMSEIWIDRAARVPRARPHQELRARHRAAAALRDRGHAAAGDAPSGGGRRARWSLVDEAPAGVAEQMIARADRAAIRRDGDHLRRRAAAGPLEDVRERLNARVLAGEIDGYVWLPADVVERGRVVYRARDVGSIGVNREVQRAATDAVRAVRLRESGIAPAQIAALVQPVELETARITQRGEEGAGEMATLGFSYVVGFLIYMMIILYGQNVMRSVLEEKTNRIVEVIISSMKASHLVAGKLLGVCAVAVLQVSIWALFMVGVLTQSELMERRLGVPVDALRAIRIEPLVAVALIGFFLLGFLLFGGHPPSRCLPARQRAARHPRARPRASTAVAVNLWYDVGSRHERPGRSGFGHLFEHLMFQGSENVERGEHMQLVERAGGSLNASITEDRTNYFQTLPPTATTSRSGWSPTACARSTSPRRTCGARSRW